MLIYKNTPLLYRLLYYIVATNVIYILYQLILCGRLKFTFSHIFKWSSIWTRIKSSHSQSLLHWASTKKYHHHKHRWRNGLIFRIAYQIDVKYCIIDCLLKYIYIYIYYKYKRVVLYGAKLSKDMFVGYEFIMNILISPVKLPFSLFECS